MLNKKVLKVGKIKVELILKSVLKITVVKIKIKRSFTK